MANKKKSVKKVAKKTVAKKSAKKAVAKKSAKKAPLKIKDLVETATRIDVAKQSGNKSAVGSGSRPKPASNVKPIVDLGKELESFFKSITKWYKKLINQK